MSFRAFAPPLLVEPRLSRRLLLLLGGSHALGLAVAVTGPWSADAAALLGLAVVASLGAVLYRHFGPARVRALALRADASWRLYQGGNWGTARLNARPYCSPGCVVLRFQVPGRGGLTVLLGRDAVPAEVFRRLRVRLRTGWAGSEPVI